MVIIGFKRKIATTIMGFKNALLITYIGMSLVACTYHVKLYDPLTYGKNKVAHGDVQGGKPIAADKIKVVIKRTTDNRLDKTRIGGLIGKSGQVFRTILFEKDVVFLDMFKNNLLNCFESAGYEVILIEKYEAASAFDKEKVKVFIESEVMRFWALLDQQPFGDRVAADVMFTSNYTSLKRTEKSGAKRSWEKANLMEYLIQGQCMRRVSIWHMLKL
jgi:hypothetical protein